MPAPNLQATLSERKQEADERADMSGIKKRVEIALSAQPKDRAAALHSAEGVTNPWR